MARTFLESPATGLMLERTISRATLCECCGTQTQHRTYIVYDRGATDWFFHAATFVRWTAHHPEKGALLDIRMRLGEPMAENAEFQRIHVHSFFDENGIESYMVQDAPAVSEGDELAHHNLRRDQVIGTPIAATVFRIIDALHEADTGFNRKWKEA